VMMMTITERHMETMEEGMVNTVREQMKPTLRLPMILQVPYSPLALLTSTSRRER
jgi:hypothetical protein